MDNSSLEPACKIIFYHLIPQLLKFRIKNRDIKGLITRNIELSFVDLDHIKTCFFSKVSANCEYKHLVFSLLYALYLRLSLNKPVFLPSDAIYCSSIIIHLKAYSEIYSISKSFKAKIISIPYKDYSFEDILCFMICIIHLKSELFRKTNLKLSKISVLFMKKLRESLDSIETIGKFIIKFSSITTIYYKNELIDIILTKISDSFLSNFCPLSVKVPYRDKFKTVVHILKSINIEDEKRREKVKYLLINGGVIAHVIEPFEVNCNFYYIKDPEINVSSCIEITKKNVIKSIEIYKKQGAIYEKKIGTVVHRKGILEVTYKIITSDDIKIINETHKEIEILSIFSNRDYSFFLKYYESRLLSEGSKYLLEITTSQYERIYSTLPLDIIMNNLKSIAESLELMSKHGIYFLAILPKCFGIANKDILKLVEYSDIINPELIRDYMINLDNLNKLLKNDKELLYYLPKEVQDALLSSFLISPADFNDQMVYPTWSISARSSIAGIDELGFLRSPSIQSEDI